MREYSSVSPSYWIGKTGKEIAEKGADAQIVSFYLLTSPHSNMLGLYWCPIMYIAHETGRGLEGAKKGLESLIDAGFCLYDYENEFVFVKEMARYQVGDSLKESDNKVKGVKAQLKQLPKNNLTGEFIKKYADKYHLNSKPLESPLEDPSKQLTGTGTGTGTGSNKQKTSIPDNFKISDRVKNWANEKGFIRLEEHLENFKLACESKGYRYKDWDSAFMTAIRKDWAGLKEQPQPGQISEGEQGW